MVLLFSQASFTLNEIPTEIHRSWRGWIGVLSRDQWTGSGSGQSEDL